MGVCLCVCFIIISGGSCGKQSVCVVCTAYPPAFAPSARMLARRGPARIINHADIIRGTSLFSTALDTSHFSLLTYFIKKLCSVAEE